MNLANQGMKEVGLSSFEGCGFSTTVHAKASYERLMEQLDETLYKGWLGTRFLGLINCRQDLPKRLPEHHFW